MRELCFAALVSALEEKGCGRAEVAAPSLSAIARMVNAAPATLYNWWGIDQGVQTVARWAGPDPAVKPSLAFLAEAKVVSFWPYRSGCLRVADVFDLSLTELACAYYRTIGVWAGDCAALARCRPAGPPSCVAEDLQVIARFAPGDLESTSVRLRSLADTVVASIFDDPSLTPAIALDGVREELMRLLAPPEDRLAARVEVILAELADRLLHGEPDDELITQAESGQIRQAMARLGLPAPAGRGT